MANLNNFSWVRRIKGANTFLLAIMGVTLIIGLNFLASTHYVRRDLTENARYTLAPETRAFLASMENPVAIIVTVTENADEMIFNDLEGLLREYVYYASRGSRAMITVEYVDLFQQRSRAQELKSDYGLDSENAILVVSEERQTLVNWTHLYAQNEDGEIYGFSGEQVFTSAVMEVSQNRSPVVYFLAGHGEMNVDEMPEFEPVDVKKISVTRPVADITDEEVDARLTQIAEANPKFDKRAKTAKARKDDAVVIDFLGKLDGEPFEGGAAEEHTLVLGSNSFIPGFEDQLIGVKAGDEKNVNVTFPENYQAANLAGQEAVFEVKVHEVRAPKTPDIDEEFAKGLGLEDLAKLKELVNEQIQNEFTGASRAKAKRNLLDILDEKHDFDLPPKMVDQEFNQIWQQLQAEMDAGRTAEEDKGKSEDELKEEYRTIAERRVRLGLVLAEIGRVADIQISEQEVQQALINEARNFPGQERQVIEFFQKDPNAMAQLRAPIYEEKVVDHILDVAKVKDETVSKEDLLKEDDE